MVSFDVLKTPLILTAARKVEKRHCKCCIGITLYQQLYLPERSDNGKKWARNIIIRPQNTTSFACKPNYMHNKHFQGSKYYVVEKYYVEICVQEVCRARIWVQLQRLKFERLFLNYLIQGKSTKRGMNCRDFLWKLIVGELSKNWLGFVEYSPFPENN